MDAIYRTTTNGYVTFSEDMEVLDCNPAMVRLLGAPSKDEIVGDFMRFSPTYQPDGTPSAQRYVDLLKEALQKGPVSLEWTHMDADRNLIPIALTLTPIQVDRRRWVLGTCNDLRYQQKIQETLNQQREQLRNILDSVPIVMAIAADDKIHAVNRNGSRLLDLQPGDFIPALYVNSEERDAALKALKRGETIDNRPIRLKDKKGNVHDTLLSLRPFIYEGQRTLLTWIVDVTELTRARQEALDASRVKSDFLASMSHEIRTPMNAILGLSHLCLQTETTPKQRDYLSKIHDAATSLLSIINDILDVSKIEAGKLTLEKAPFRLADAFASLKDLVAFRAEEKGLAFDLIVDPGVPACLGGDVLRLNQILLNLCNNAIKFTERGRVEVRVHAAPPFKKKEEAGEAVHLHFAVSDTGIGMTDKQLARLFSPFSQADSSITRRYGGSGLGLAICKSLVEAMDGQIGVESVFGEGTVVRFRVLLDVEKEEPAGRDGPDDPAPTARLRGDVLLVEDNQINRMIAEELLKEHDIRVDTAANGAEALEAVKNGEYDLVLMDIQMPVMDGLEATQRIRELPGRGADRLPIVAMTAHAMQSDHEKSLKAGMNDHLTKPIDPDEFNRMLRKWLGKDRR